MPSTFDFPREIRPYVRSLTNLMHIANQKDSQQWAAQSYLLIDSNGVYGFASHTLRKLVELYTSEAVALRFRDAIGDFLGSNATYYEDTIDCVNSCLANLEEEAEVSFNP